MPGLKIDPMGKLDILRRLFGEMFKGQSILMVWVELIFPTNRGHIN
jgi:hypothetical protein